MTSNRGLSYSAVVMIRALQERYTSYSWHLEGFTPVTARRAVEETLFLWGMPAESVDDAMLIASEIATNAAMHVRPELRRAGFIHAHIGQSSDTLRFEIADPDPRTPRLIQATSDDEQYRGLIIVDALAKDWGFYRASMGLGKIVWWTQAVI
ncbi:ATP-binding protein [Nonomuraea sp. NPDC059194]|uniref:ATP-binding protein n=1 Tax=Nonomuraea sp. NPDC059194 TaxID=3346764 RepID=UPI0036A19BB3